MDLIVQLYPINYRAKGYATASLSGDVSDILLPHHIHESLRHVQDLLKVGLVVGNILSLVGGDVITDEAYIVKEDLRGSDNIVLNYNLNLGILVRADKDIIVLCHIALCFNGLNNLA